MPTSPVLPKLVGERVKRREDPRLIQGRGTFVDDLKIAGMQLDHAPGDEMALHVLKEVNEPLFSRVMNTRAQIAEKVHF